MKTPVKQILLVDDEEKLMAAIARRLVTLGFEPLLASSGEAAIEVAMKNPIDLAIVDLQIPDMDGLVTITRLKEIDPSLKTIVLTGHGGGKAKQAAESLNTVYFEKKDIGRFWTFIKEINSGDKVVSIHPEATLPRSPAALNAPPGSYLGNETGRHAPGGFISPGESVSRFSGGSRRTGDTDRLRIVGETPAMRELRKEIERVAPLDCMVTLCGEPGTGKELVARAIHARSIRREQRFLAINCAHCGNEQHCGQLLGYESGDLAEAIRARSGIFSSGPVGTLLFDQIEGLPAKMQDQVQGILDMVASQRAGALQEPGVDIRIIAATDVDLAERTRAGRFNRGLYDRLQLYVLNIPPLRERKDDIPPLCRYFFDKYRREMGKSVDSISTEVVQTLVDYDFPGNVRELEQIIERGVILADGKTIDRRHLPARFNEERGLSGNLKPGPFSTLAELERRHIVEVLAATKGNKTRTAKILGISRAALWRKLKQLRAEHPDR